MFSKMSLLILAACLALAVGSFIPQNRIVGGSAARAGQYPYAASIQTPQSGHICGGAIISSRWVLTAASCTIYLGPGLFTVRTGSISSRAGVQHQVSNLVNHPQFDFETRRNDIALVQTVLAIANNANSRPIALGRNAAGAASAVVIGWGRTDVNNGSKPTALQYLNTATISNRDCYNGLQNYGFQNYLRDTNVCSLTRPGEGICRADSGSPLATNNELVGIASFGVSCATGAPDVFTRVQAYADWIGRTAV